MIKVVDIRPEGVAGLPGRRQEADQRSLLPLPSPPNLRAVTACSVPRVIDRPALSEQGKSEPLIQSSFWHKISTPIRLKSRRPVASLIVLRCGYRKPVWTLQ